MKSSVDWTNPETFKPPKEVFDRYQNDNECVHNAIARKDPNEDFLLALAKYDVETAAIVSICGKTVDEYIGGLPE